VANFVNFLCAEINIYVPLAPHLLTVFECTELAKACRSSRQNVPDLQYVLKVSDDLLKTREYQEKITGAALDLLLRHFAVYSYSIAFPELVLPTKFFLKRFAKKTRIVRVSKQIQQFLKRVDMNSDFIKKKRAAVTISPKAMAEQGVSPMTFFRPSEDSSNSSNSAKSDISPLQRFIGSLRDGVSSTSTDVAKLLQSTNRIMSTYSKSSSSKSESKPQQQQQTSDSESSGNDSDSDGDATMMDPAQTEDVVGELVLSSSDDDDDEDDDASDS
jgi:nucleolar complex protein 2